MKELYRKGVSALILNSKNQILLVNLVSFATHFFAIPGGGIEPEENPEQSISREIQEELGLLPKHFTIEKRSKEPIRFIFRVKPLVHNGITYTGQERIFFLVRFVGDDNNIKLDKKEVRKYTWSSFSDLGKYLLFEDQMDETISQIEQLCPEIMEK